MWASSWVRRARQRRDRFGGEWIPLGSLEGRPGIDRNNFPARAVHLANNAPLFNGCG
jgi:hypothetical protein